MEYTSPDPRSRSQEQNQSSVQFELSQANVLKTAKDLRIKEVFSVDDREVSTLKGQRVGRTAVAGSVYTMSTSDFLVGVTSLVSAPSVGLPDPRLVGVGKHYIVKDEVGGAATTTITIRSEGERNIDGSSSTTLTTNYQAKRFYTDGLDWFTV